MQKLEDSWAIWDKLGTLLTVCNSTKREKDMAKCHPKGQVYSHPPNKAIAKGKWSVQLVALIYSAVHSRYFRYILPLFSHPLSAIKHSLILSLFLGCLFDHTSKNTELFLQRDFEIGSNVLYYLRSFVCLVLFRWLFFHFILWLFFTSWFIFHFIYICCLVFQYECVFIQHDIFQTCRIRCKILCKSTHLPTTKGK